MSHLHIPDGILPMSLWVAGWFVTLAMIWGVGMLSEREARRRVPLVAVVSALMLVGMSSEIVPIAYHVNLSVVGGALVGPFLAPVAAFIVVLVLALLGHGGVTVVGLNVLVITSEMILGWLLFSTAVRLLGRERVRPAALIATVLTLALSTLLTVGIVWLAGERAAVRESGSFDVTTLRFDSPFDEGLFSQGLFSGGEAEESGTAESGLSTRRFATVVFALGPMGWLLEALVTAAILGYIARVRPTLIFGGAGHERRLPGDEAAH